VAVVLSCHSEKVGQIFRKAGIKHVICIKRDCKIQDEACLTFARTFYSYLLNGNWNKICEAYIAGKKAVADKINCSESTKFLCLCDHKPDTCDVGFSFIDGLPYNKSYAVKIKSLPECNKSIIGRSVDNVKIMSKLIHK
jgi:hypothetical protein